MKDAAARRLSRLLGRNLHPAIGARKVIAYEIFQVAPELPELGAVRERKAGSRDEVKTIRPRGGDVKLHHAVVEPFTALPDRDESGRYPA